MSVLTATGLALSYGAQDVFRNVTLEVSPADRVAVVGPNGVGKSSLLRILARTDAPTAGVVHWARGARVVYLEQEPTFAPDETVRGLMRTAFADLARLAAELARLEASMADPATADDARRRYEPLQAAFESAGGYETELTIDRVLAGLGFDPRTDQPLATLSGGWRTRAALAAALLARPDALLLDEPTNHLDLDAVEWLEGYLRAWPGALVVVAHDRAFLDAVVHRILELAPEGLTAYTGGYTAYAAQRAERRARQAQLAARQAAEVARTEDYIRRNLAGQNTKQAQGRRTRLAALERIAGPERDRPPAMRLTSGTRHGDRAFALEGAVVGYESGRPVLATGAVEVWRGRRVALLGANGSGKTTLLRTIAQDLPPLAGRARLGGGVILAVFSQTQADLDPSATPLATIERLGLERQAARDLLGAYGFTGDASLKAVGALSGGEKARLALAALGLTGANLLLLDEPTNHLDIASQEVLQALLEDFPGTILFVTHDRYLARALADEVWVAREGALEVYDEGYESWRAAEEARRTASGARAEAERYQSARQAARATERDARRAAEARVAAEQRVADLEAGLATVEADLAAAAEAQDVARIADLGARHEALAAEHEVALRAWLDLADGPAAEPD